MQLHRESQKGAAVTMTVTLSILHRFAKFFHCRHFVKNCVSYTITELAAALDTVYIKILHSSHTQYPSVSGCVPKLDTSTGTGNNPRL